MENNSEDDFSQNLRFMCRYFNSIADVCRRLNINRSQFNRYLNGRFKPSSTKLRQICDFFGVEEYEILLPHNQFQRLIQIRPKSTTDVGPQTIESPHFSNLKQYNANSIQKYLGYYFEYYMSMAYPGQILRNLVCLEMRENSVYYQRTERIQEHKNEKAYHAIYLGMAYLLSDRIFMVDYESLTGNEISQTILFPSFKNRISKLTGLKLSVSGSGERMPCCARILFEYLGPSVDKRKALSLCGLYNSDAEEIDETIRKSIQNRMEENQHHFRAVY